MCQSPSVMNLDCSVLFFGQPLLSNFNLASPSRPGPMTGDGHVLRVDPIIFPHPLRIRGWFQEGQVIQGEPIGILPSPIKKVLNSLVTRRYGWKCGVVEHHACRLVGRLEEGRWHAGEEQRGRKRFDSFHVSRSSRLFPSCHFCSLVI